MYFFRMELLEIFGKKAPYQWCSVKFSLVGMLTWHTLSLSGGGGGGVFLNEWSFIKGKNQGSNIGVYFLRYWGGIVIHTACIVVRCI